MEDKRVETILEALVGATRREWELIKEYIDREYDAEARLVTMSPLMADRAQRALACEQQIGTAKPREGTRQTKMF